MSADPRRSLVRLADQLGYSASGGLVEVSDSPANGAQVAILDRVRRHLPEIAAVYFSGEVPLAYFTLGRSDSTSRASIHRRVWNDSHVPLLFIINSSHVRVYDAWAEPTLDPAKADDTKRLIRKLSSTADFLSELAPFHRVRLDTGTYSGDFPDRFLPGRRCEVTLLENLQITRNRLAQFGDLPDDAIHALLIRSILILHLESRGKLGSINYESLLPGANKLTELFADRSATYRFFDELAHRFNGDLFPLVDSEILVKEHHLKILERCLEGREKIDLGQFTLWPLYDFSVIPIQLISSVYEWLLHCSDLSNAREEGAFYTPFSLVELMLNEVLPWPGVHQVTALPRVIDPSCGSGVFLVEAYRRLIAHWRRLHPRTDLTMGVLTEILMANLRGIDKNPLAIKVAAFSLYLAMLDHIDDKKLLDEMRFPSLTSKESGQGASVLLAADVFDLDASIERSFDIVVGNPPWRRKRIPPNVHKWCEERGYPVAGEIAHAFMWLARDLAKAGEVAILCPAKWLFNREKPDVEFRVCFFEKTEVQTVINLSALVGGEGRLFTASAPASAVVFKSERSPEPSRAILYCTPRPARTTASPDALLIDAADVKYLPRVEAELSADIWKVLYVGNWRDLRLSRRLRSKGQTLGEFINHRKWIEGRGFQPNGEKRNKTIPMLPFVDAKIVGRYLLRERPSSAWPYNSFKWTGPLEIYREPHVLLKEGLDHNRLCAALVTEGCSFRDTITGIHAPDEDLSSLKAMVVFINSSIASYQLFLTGNWGIDRWRVKKSEIFDFLPAYVLSSAESVSLLAELFDKYQKCESDEARKAVEKEMDEAIFQLFSLSPGERILVLDMLRSIEYLRGGAASGLADPPTESVLSAYARAFKVTFEQAIGSGKGLSTTLYRGMAPLSIVSFAFGEDAQTEPTVLRDRELQSVLSRLDHTLLEREGVNMYRRRHLTFFEDEMVHIVKPAETRFWTKSAAFHDADEILAQTLTQPNDAH